MIESRLPSPKLQTAATSGHRHWYRFYAMFSEAFAQRVVSGACLPSGATILDPWLGVGTTTAVATAAGFRSVGGDINPVMATISRGRVLSRSEGAECVGSIPRLLPAASERVVYAADPLSGWFGKKATATLRRYEQAIRAIYDEQQLPAQAAFLLTALFEAATELARPYRSKNPTWIKKPTDGAKADAPAAEVRRLFESAARRRLQLCPEVRGSYVPFIRTMSSTCLDLPNSSIDLTLTSPPYCTRIDYAVCTSVELAVLGVESLEIERLRDETTGTSTIRKASYTPLPEWGNACRAILTKIAGHPSKSSLVYYYKTYLQYFGDLFQSVRQIARCMKPSGQIVIVVQDSVYKGIAIELPKIVTEMGEACGWKPLDRIGFATRRNMRRMNTPSRAYLPDVDSTETVLCFSASS